MNAGEFCALCKTGTPRQVKAALDAGADVNSKEDNNCSKNITALMCAAGYNRNFDVIKLLLEHGAEIDALNGDDETALMYAARHSDLSVIKILIEYGADVNAADNGGYTALMCAAGYNKNLDVTKVLLEHGADVNAENGSYGTALMWAVCSSKNPDIITALIEYGADVTIGDEYDEYYSVLDRALENKHLAGTDALEKLRAADASAPLNTRKFGELCKVGTYEEVKTAIEAPKPQEPCKCWHVYSGQGQKNL